MQIDSSMEQDFLYHEEEIIYPRVVNVVYEHDESQQNSEEIDWSKTLVGMPTFTIKEIVKYRQLNSKIQGLPITKTLVRGRKFRKKDFLTQTQYTLQKLKVYLKWKTYVNQAWKKISGEYLLV